MNADAPLVQNMHRWKGGRGTLSSSAQDVPFSPQPKPVKRKKKDKSLKSPKFCEWCGIYETKAELEVHCIYSKGGSGPGYTPENTITLCVGPPGDCHDKAQKYIYKREDLIELVAMRLGRTIQDVKETLQKQRRK